jgi:hypothetical protein
VIAAAEERSGKRTQVEQVHGEDLVRPNRDLVVLLVIMLFDMWVSDHVGREKVMRYRNMMVLRCIDFCHARFRRDSLRYACIN